MELHALSFLHKGMKFMQKMVLHLKIWVSQKSFAANGGAMYKAQILIFKSNYYYYKYIAQRMYLLNNISSNCFLVNKGDDEC